MIKVNCFETKQLVRFPFGSVLTTQQNVSIARYVLPARFTLPI